MKAPWTVRRIRGLWPGQRGFSLIELMAVIAIIGILGAMAFPAVQQMIAAERVRSAASALYEALLIARSEAVKRNTSVEFDYAGGALADGWTVVTAGGDTVHAQVALPNATFNPTAPAFEFNGTGRMTGGGDVTISAIGTSTSRCVRVVNSRPSVSTGGC